MDTDEKSAEMSAFRGTRGHNSKMTKNQRLRLKVKIAYADDLPVISQWEIVSLTALMIDFMDLQLLMHITVFHFLQAYLHFLAITSIKGAATDTLW